jgi:hypothetical protein
MLLCRCSRTPTLSTFVQGEAELISGVRLVPVLGHTTDDCVVTLGSGAWQAMFLTDTIASCLSRQGDQAQSNHSLGSGPNEPMAARVEPSPPSSGVGGGAVFAGTLVVTPTGVLSELHRLPPYDPA